jgi:hypothetical protein
MRTTNTWMAALVLCTIVPLAAGAAEATSPSPLATLPTPAASPSAILGGATHTPTRPTATVTARPVASPSASPDAVESEAGLGTDEPAAAPAATALAPRPRAFRTPERAAPPPFVAPEAGAPTDEDPTEPHRDGPNAAAPGAGSGGTALVVFRVTARTVIEGVDLRVSYPDTLGTFAVGGQSADCNAGTGTLVVANDRGTGELRVLVASAQALPLPLDVFCRFAVAGGQRPNRGAFAVRVAEVTSDAKRADTSLVIVDVVIR